jgi:hypothetical protein
MGNTAAINYRGFYDVPRIFLVSHRGMQLLFDCKFDDSIDDYPDFYKVYLMPAQQDLELSGSWDRLPELAIEYLGDVQVSSVKFDRTLRKEIDTDVIRGLLESHAE